jgi:hypothetical protein
MFEIKPRDPDMEFSPGRYALVIRGAVSTFPSQETSPTRSSA